jgi:predicted nucleic acid-binding protein
VKALYLETSALVQAYVEEAEDVYAALHGARRGRKVCTSALTEVELRRAIHRMQHETKLSNKEAADTLGVVLQLLQHVALLPLGEAVLARAGDHFPHQIRSLDAIHVATALVLHQRREVEEVVMFSRDRRVRENAAALGLRLV